MLIILRFGNFIGEASESEDDSQHGVDAAAYEFDEDQEEAPEVTGQELMEIDGRFLLPFSLCLLALTYCR